MGAASRTRQWEAAIEAAIASAEEDVAARRRARRDAYIAIAATIPDPEEYARYVPLRIALALSEAWFCGLGWRVAANMVAEMRPLGLVEYGGPCLTAFGITVRRVLVEEDIV